MMYNPNLKDNNLSEYLHIFNY